jgi:predicted nucleic acid-binding Zn ribbon protein
MAFFARCSTGAGARTGRPRQSSTLICPRARNPPQRRRAIPKAPVSCRRPLRAALLFTAEYALAVATCLSCGQANPDGARFCSACGAELVAMGSREVRKTGTVLFADVTGSTALGEQLDPEGGGHSIAAPRCASRCTTRFGVSATGRSPIPAGTVGESRNASVTCHEKSSSARWPKHSAASARA